MDFGGEGDHRLVIDEVDGGEVGHGPPRVADLGGDALQALAVAIGEKELRAPGGQGECRRPADPAGRARDQAALAAQVSDADLHNLASKSGSTWSELRVIASIS